MPIKEKVYCANCMYRRENIPNIPRGHVYCFLSPYVRSSNPCPWDKPEKLEIDYRHCSEVNKNNDCTMYFEKPTKVRVSFLQTIIDWIKKL